MNFKMNNYQNFNIHTLNMKNYLNMYTYINEKHKYNLLCLDKSKEKL